MMVERGGHKGENGKLLIVGGSRDYVGCLALAGLAALRTGIDLVYIAAPEKVAWSLNSYSPDLITIKLPGDRLAGLHFNEINAILNRADAVLLGTGSGTSPSTKALFDELVKIKKPKIIDADALKLIDPLALKNAILTPHKKEFEIAFGEKPSRETLLKFARPDRVILLKGEVDLISDGRNVYENKTGNSGMTVGGTGDTLAGIVAGLVCQGLDLIEAAKLGVRINGLAGDLAFNKFGYGLLASDLLDQIPEVMKKEVWQSR